MNEIPVIDLDSNDPRQRGTTYGETAKKEIQELLKVYRELFQIISRKKWDQIVDQIPPYIKQVDNFAPDLLEEVRGIADGAGCAFEEIFTINARSEILFEQGIHPQECSSVAAIPEATQNGDTLLAQNWDWYKETVDCQVILKISGREGVPPMVTFTEAGQLAKIGMNGAGIGLAVNNLMASVSRIGVPWIFLTRRVLESNNFTEAVGKILASPKAHSMNFMIARAGGEAVDLETSPVEDHLIWPEDGTLAHTNHYLRLCQDMRDRKPVMDQYPSTFIRQRRIAQGLKARNRGLDANGIQDIFKDHFDYPFSVCIHENTKLDPKLYFITCMSIVMNLDKQLICYTKGNPCCNPVHELELSDFFNGTSN